MKRPIAALPSIPFPLVVLAGPPRHCPKDGDPAQGCENTKAQPLKGYCSTT